MKRIIFSLMVMATMLAFTSCENGDIEFGDYYYQTVYFAKQTPIRPIVLGDDIFDRTLDNQHRFKVFATLGGVEKNKSDRKVVIAVDNTLCDGLTYSDGRAVLPLPAEYYTMSGNTLTIPAGNIMGAVDVQLTDAFFNDPKATSLNYVLPLRIVSCADSVLEDREHTLYGLYYLNKYDGAWLCHGTDEIDLNGEKSTVVRDAEYVEDYDLRYLSTVSLQEVRYPVSTTVEVVNGKTTTIETLTCDLVLTFDNDDCCTVTTDTEGCEVSGTGTWERGGAKKAWNGTDRDLLKLNYTVTYHYTTGGATAYKKLDTTEELIMRDRQVNKLETFTTNR